MAARKSISRTTDGTVKRAGKVKAIPAEATDAKVATQEGDAGWGESGHDQDPRLALNSDPQSGPGDAAFSAWQETAIAMGLSEAEMLWDLHVVQGRSLAQAARLLGVDGPRATALHAEMRLRRMERAPRCEADFQAVREELRDRLLSILEDASRAPEDPRLLAVRQRVCDQLADLYGLNLQRRSGPGAGNTPGEETPPAHVTPPSLTAEVESFWRRIHGREEDILAIKA